MFCVSITFLIATYNFKSSINKTISLGTGDRSHVVNNCCSGDIPNLLIVGLISTESYMGNYSTNPWVFLPYSLSCIGYPINGTCLPHGPLQPTFVTDKYQDSDFAQTYSTPEEFVQCLN
jgi:hypothetical protein